MTAAVAVFNVQCHSGEAVTLDYFFAVLCIGRSKGIDVQMIVNILTCSELLNQFTFPFSASPELTPDWLQRAANSFITARVSFLFFLNYLRAITWLKLETTLLPFRSLNILAPLPLFISHPLSITHFLWLPFAHCPCWVTSKWVRARLQINSLPHQQSISGRLREKERRQLYWWLRRCCHTWFSLYILLTWGPLITLVLILTSQSPANSIMAEM